MSVLCVQRLKVCWKGPLNRDKPAFAFVFFSFCNNVTFLFAINTLLINSIYFSGSISDTGEHTHLALVEVPVDADAVTRDGVRHSCAADAGAEDLSDLEGVLHRHT